MRRLVRCGFATVVAAVAAGALPFAAAAADPKLPGASPAIQQYIEMIPTAAGAVAAGGGGQGDAKIPAATKRAIAKTGGSNADLLTKVVSSPAYGAPTRFRAPTPTPAKPTTPRSSGARKPAPHATTPAPLPATPRAVAPARLPPAPNALSAASGSFGVEGVAFGLVLAGAVGLGILPRLARRGRAA